MQSFSPLQLSTFMIYRTHNSTIHCWIMCIFQLYGHGPDKQRHTEEISPENMSERARVNDRNNHQQQGPDEQTNMEESTSENMTERRSGNEAQSYQQRGPDEQGAYGRQYTKTCNSRNRREMKCTIVNSK